LAGTIFEIIGIIAIILFGLIMLAILFFMGKGIKHLNKILGSRRGEVSKDLVTSLKSLQQAQDQLEAVSIMTATVKDGMSAAIGITDKAVDFLKSDAFQVGLPLTFWFLLVAVAVPRGFLGKKKHKKKKTGPIPPASWELEPR